jgi:hypothetical protein
MTAGAGSMPANLDQTKMTCQGRLVGERFRRGIGAAEGLDDLWPQTRRNEVVEVRSA